MVFIRWLSVVTIYHDFDEAKVILSHILSNIKHLEQIKESRLYLINAYVSVSQYYYVLFDYNEVCVLLMKFEYLKKNNYIIIIIII